MDDIIISPFMRRLVWLNIAIQLIFPLAVVFTPAISAAAEQRFLQSSAPIAQALQTGDEGDLPGLTTKPATPEDKEDKQIQQMAGYASQMGNFLSSRPDSDTATSQVRTMASSAASNEIRQWLSQLGTARVQLDANQHFSLKNSQLDLLVPLYAQKDSLVFSQGSLHRTDQRNQSSLGVGLRHFTPGYMLGGNLFWDYDLSRNHARMGVGLEYWRDFIKVGSNGYIGLTDWKNSPDLANYEERPASGWDLRAQAWMPWLPQLGGKLLYEKYYGREVALHGVDNRQRNPNAVSVGINYTPVPLVTLGAERRMELEGKSDTRLNIGVNYRFGMLLRKQLESSAVAGMRSLAGSRNDLVDRNNNIVLAYRKKASIRLQMAEQVTGLPGEQKSLRVSITSVYGVSRIDWEAADFIAAGGKIVKSGEDWAVVLPSTYQTKDSGVNTWTIGGVAVDKKGNHSGQRRVQITVQQPLQPAQEKSTIVTDSAGYSSGDAMKITVALKNADGEIVTGYASALTSDAVKVPNATFKSAWKDEGDGTYSATWQSVQAGTGLKATLKLAGWQQASESAIYTITAGVPAPERSELAISAVPNEKITATRKGRSVKSERYSAGGIIAAKVTLRDSQGNAVSGYALKAEHIAFPNSVLKSSWEDNGDGTYSATYQIEQSGTGLKATLKLSEWNLVVESTSFSVTAGAAVQQNSAVITDNTRYTAGEVITVTVSLKDAQNNVVAGAAAELTAGAVAVPNATLSGGWTDNGDGTYRGAYTAATAGTGLKATLKLAGWTATGVSPDYAIVPDQAVDFAIVQGQAVKENSAVRTDKTRYAAGEIITVTVSLKDAQNTVVAGAAAELTAGAVTVPNATLSGGWTDNGDGTYRGAYTAATAGTGLKATLKLAGWTASGVSPDYAIVPGQAVQQNSAVITDNTRYTAGEVITVTVSLKDAQNNVVAGAAAELTAGAVAVPNATLSGGWTDNGDGTYRGAYTAATAGTGLKATLKLAGWTATGVSPDYAIVPGQAVQQNSAVSTDNTRYTAGEVITVTVSLKDAQNNVVAGAAAELTAGAVTVPNATLSGGWTDNGDGTYRGAYTAATAGTGLKATLKLAGWTASGVSPDYAIVPGQAVKENSAVSTDNTRYTAGEAITVTVSLKDAQNNVVAGAAAELTAVAVTVPNATLSGGWTDNGDGTYRGAYTAAAAGTGLKATLKLAGWQQASESAIYTITAGVPAPERSELAISAAPNEERTVTRKGRSVKSERYSAGGIIAAKVTLRDSQGNAVSGYALKAEHITFPNSVLKSSWEDNGDGTYSATYQIEQSGTGLKATLKLSEWNLVVESASFSVTAGAAVQQNSTVITDKTRYTAGEAITVTVSLKDAQNNVVAGAAAELTAGAVTVPNAILSGGWTDNGDGTYRGAYTAATAGTGLKATLKLAGWTASGVSPDYAIVPGQAVKENSAVSTDNTRYTAGEAITVTVSLKDAQNNVVAGAAAELTAVAVAVPNATLSSGWTDNGDGTYRGAYTAATAGTGLKATLKLAGWTASGVSPDYAIVSGTLTVSGQTQTPHVKFEQQSVTHAWTRQVIASPKVSGIPDEVSLQWSASDSSVATVDNTGKLTLLKAGEAIVTVSTTGNNLWKPAKASYTLKVSKAEPSLKVASKSIAATWGDGVSSIGASFGNSDVQNLLTPVYISKNTAVVTVNGNGKLTAVKPGATVITVSTPETDQFLAASTEVDYTLNKATLEIRFAKPVVEMSDKDRFETQKPTITIPSDAQAKWSSSDLKVVNIFELLGVPQFAVTNKGQTRLTLTVAASDYYNASTGYYDVKVYSKPSPHLKITNVGKGIKGGPAIWTPVYTDDSLTVVWGSDISDEFTKAEKLTLTIRDNYGIEHVKETSSSGEDKTTTLKADAKLLGKVLYIELVAKGYGTLSSTLLDATEIVRLAPDFIWKTAQVRMHTEGNGRVTWLQSGGNSKLLYRTLKVDLPPEKLISPMNITLKSVYRSGDGIVEAVRDNFSLSSGSYSSLNAGGILANDIWAPNSGTFRLQLDVEYGGENYTYETSDYYWSGRGRQLTRTFSWFEGHTFVMLGD